MQGDKIIQMAAECPLDVAAAVLMDPVRGPSIPATPGEAERAFRSQLHEIELDQARPAAARPWSRGGPGADARRARQVHRLKMTEVDRWIAALEAGGLLPSGAAVALCTAPARVRGLVLVVKLSKLIVVVLPRQVFGAQEALFAAGITRLGDVDHLDPGVRGEMGAGERAAREEAIGKQLELFGATGPPQEVEAPAAGLRVALVAAVVRRNDNALRALRDTDCDDAGADPMAAAERAQEEFDSAGWDVPRLVRVRVGIRRAARKYRKTKKKFDRAVVRAIRLQDLGGAREASRPTPPPG